MDKTVSFFDMCKKLFLKVKEVSMKMVFLVILMVLFGIYFFTNFKNVEKILNMATNVRMEEKVEKISIQKALKIYPVLNSNNYVLAKETIDKEETNSNEEKEIISTDTSFFDASAVDAISNIITIDKPNYSKKSTNYYDKVTMYGVTIYDYSSKKIDFEELFDRNVNLTKKSDPILMYCSHTSESYSNSENFVFSYSGNYRSKDASYNMLSVASIMSKTLIERGINVIFDTTAHDYTSYDNAYKNSLKTIEKNMEQYSRFGMVIDVHRDAAADLSFGPKITVNKKETAKLMLVIGVGYEGYPNEYWKENLSLALHIAKIGEEMYPGLFRQVLVRDARYNQQVSPGSILVEVGATGNTLEEAYYSARCFANIIAKLYK